jgi:pantoate--beta-alanine ligase
MSSRNLRLSPSQRTNATVLYQALVTATNSLRSGVPLETVKKAVFEMVNSKPEFKVEYFELADSKNLMILNNVDKVVLPILCIAAYAGEIRLIDNMFLD